MNTRIMHKIKHLIFKKIVESKYFEFFEKELFENRNSNDWFSENYLINKTVFLFTALLDAEAVIIGSYHPEEEKIESISFIVEHRFKDKICISSKYFNLHSKDVNFRQIQIIPAELSEINIVFGIKSKSIAYIPLINDSKEIIGILIAFFNSTSLSQHDKNTFSYFSSLFSSELYSKSLHKKLENQYNAMKKTQYELEHKNSLLVKLNSTLAHNQKVMKENVNLRTAFLSNLSHEIKTPMNVILGYNEMLNSKSLTQNELNEYTSIIRNNGKQLLQIMDSLIDISKIQANEMVYTNRSFSLNQILRQVYENHLPKIEEKSKDIIFKYIPGLDTGDDIVKNNKESIFKVLNHLVDNAIKFTDKGEIEFGYEAFDNYIRFFVKDTGVGINQNQDSHIFDIFHQSDFSKTRKYGGIGIGLSISKKLVEAINGKIWYESNENKGSSFYFTAPL